MEKLETPCGPRQEFRSLAGARRPRASLRAPDPQVTPTRAEGQKAEPGSRGQAAYRAVGAAQRHHQLCLVLVRLLGQLKSLLHRKPLLRCHGAGTGTAREWLWLAIREGLRFPRLPAVGPARVK